MDNGMRWVVWDIEANGLNPDKIYCLSFEDSDGTKDTYTDYEDIKEFFKVYDVYVGHNIRRWDLPVLEGLLGVTIPENVIDTLGLAWCLDPLRKKHGLEWYGEHYGVPKPKIKDWDNQPLEEYINRCEQDVQINVRLWKDQLRLLTRLYPEWSDFWSYVRYIDFKLRCAVLQEESRWKLDVTRCESALAKLEVIRDEKLYELTLAMPRVPVVRTLTKPKRYRNADGELSVLGQRWKERLDERGLPEDYDGTLEEITDYVDGNPASHVQLKDWLYSLGWVPQTIKYQRSKTTGEIKEIPQINKEHGAGICDSIVKLYEKEPNLELLDGLSVLNHRISIFRGFLRDLDADGYLSARVAGLTNTLRFKHAELVNLPKPEKPFAEDIRACLIADEGVELCGSDMSGLEDRLKQHFIQPLDPEYVEELNRSDYDPHLDIAVIAGLMTQGEADAYKAGDHSKKSVRSIAKNGNYACQYGAGANRVSITCGISLEGAKDLHRAYWERNWAIKEVAKQQHIVTLPSFDGLEDQLWLYNPISGFYYSLRTEKDIFSTLVQGSASYCFDIWVGFVLQEREQLTAQFHDEIVLTIRKGHREGCEALLRDCISKTNDFLKLNRELDIDVQFGSNYGEIH